jgi:hypothetical protein
MREELLGLMERTKLLQQHADTPLKSKTSYVWRKAITGRNLSTTKSKKELATGILRRRNGLVNVTWKEFLKQYERFTDVLCVAAKHGCDETLEKEYNGLRIWFTTRYHRVSERLRPYLVGLSFEPKAVKKGMATEAEYCDVFESFFRGRSLSDILSADTGDLIRRVSQISEAVYQCDHDG